MDVVDYGEFYSRPLGRATCRLVSAALRPMLRPQPGQTVLGLGHAVPYLDALTSEQVTSLAFMLARQGVTHWPKSGLVRSALVDEYDLPLLESSIDHALVVHGLERADTPLEMLQEIWRVMAPQGRLLLVVPNRRGIWSSSETSPFGYGQPFSRSQLAKLLKDAQFSVTQWQHALFMPPTQMPAAVRAAVALERIGKVSFYRFSGVIIVEAMKQVLLPAPPPARKE
jgi:SAM-dependent methyltransferase